MNKLKKATSAIFLALAIILSSSACSSGAGKTATAQTGSTSASQSPQAASASNELYGMVVFLKGSEFFNWCYAGFEDAAASVGAKTELVGPADSSATSEANSIQELIAKKASGICVTASDANTLVNPINTALKAKIPTITFDSDSPKSNRLMFIGSDPYQSGYQAGVMLGKNDPNAKVGIGMVPGLDAITGRIKGFQDGLKSVAPNAAVIAQVNDQQDPNKGEQAIAAMLQSHPEINTVFCTDGASNTGAAKAPADVGRNSGDNAVKVIAFAQDVPILQMVQNGELYATVVQDPYLEGVESFYHLYSAAHPTQFDNPNAPGFGNVPTSSIDTGVWVVKKGDKLIDAMMNPPKIK